MIRDGLQAFYIIGRQLVTRTRQPTDLRDLRDCNIIVTGANSGIGFETAKALAAAGGCVVVACRDTEKGEEAKSLILKEYPKASVIVEELDLGSLKNVRAFADRIKKRFTALHILVNNAGIMFMPFTKSEDGVEMHMAVNHLGHYALTLHLMDLLKRGAKNGVASRIVNLSSTAHYRGKLNLDKINDEKSFSPIAAYAQSKLANVLFTFELQRRLRQHNVAVYAVHPGVVNTNLFHYVPTGLQTLNKAFAAVVFRTAEQGAATSIFAAASKSIESLRGKYLDNCAEEQASLDSYDEDLQARLWKWSASVSGLDLND